MKEKLAKISKATLGMERGILSFWIHVSYEDGTGQGVGGLALDSYDEDSQKRVGSAYGCEMIRRLLHTLGVDDFSEMKNKHVWVLGEGIGFSFSPKGIRPLNVDDSRNREDTTLIFSDVYEQMRKE